MRGLSRLLCALTMLALIVPAAARAGEPDIRALPLSGEELPAETELLSLTCGGSPAPCDRASATWYIPSGADVRADAPSSWRIYRAPSDRGDVALCATDGERWRAAHIVFTGLPVLCIDTEDGELPGDGDMPATLALYEADGEGGVSVVRTPVEINLRGNTSRRFPKQSYRLKIVDGRGAKRDLSIAGLRADDDWLLNPMYSDTSKIREALGYWLWEEMNSCGRAAASSRFAYAEVLLNGAYWGLYGVQERVDRKQVDANRDMGILYKVAANDCPTPGELLSCADPERCGGLELAYAGEWVEGPWAPAADYAALLEGAEPPGGSRLSPENAADFCLWSVLVQAKDNRFKNQFIHCAYTDAGYVLYRIPWDLDHTLGDLWVGDSPQTNYIEYGVTGLALDDLARRMADADDAGLRAALAARWRELRAGPIGEEAILARARALFEGLRPAIERDSLRWPECGMGEGNAANIRDIEDYVRAILPRVDGWLGLPAEDTMETETESNGADMDC